LDRSYKFIKIFNYKRFKSIYSLKQTKTLQEKIIMKIRNYNYIEIKQKLYDPNTWFF